MDQLNLLRTKTLKRPFKSIDLPGPDPIKDKAVSDASSATFSASRSRVRKSLVPTTGLSSKTPTRISYACFGAVLSTLTKPLLICVGLRRLRNVPTQQNALTVRRMGHSNVIMSHAPVKPTISAHPETTGILTG